MARSIRSQITRLATVVTLGICVVVCIGMYVGLHVGLFREVDSFLEGEVHEFRAILLHERDDELKEIEREIRAEIGSRSKTDLVFRLLDSEGKLLITSDPNDRFPNPWLGIAGSRRENVDVWFETVDEPEAQAPYRTCAQWEDLPNHGQVVIQAAYRVDRAQRSLALARLLGLGALIVAAVLSFLGGRAIARGSMTPVVRITNAARQISGQHLTSRVPLVGTNDELDTLSQTLNEMLERAEQSFRQIQQFTADAAHELRTPLTALIGTAELALSQPRSEEQLKTVIEKSLEYYRLLARVTDDLLLLARLDAGQEPIQHERLNLTQVIEDVVDLYQPLANERGIQVNRSRSDETWIIGDDHKIRRVLSNLLDNAIKFTPGQGVISVNLSTSKERATITVKDEGIGISGDDLPHVFERFFRADPARTSRDANSRGAGLGLTICRSVILAHQGEITVTSEPGRGTEVTVWFPVAEGSQSSTASN